MLIIITVIFVTLYIFISKEMDNVKSFFNKYQTTAFVMNLLCGFIASASFLFFIITTVNVIDGMSSDNKLVVYEEENTKIENSINEIVLNYMDHETKVFNNAKGDLDPTLIFTLYPDLKSNELVKSQIDVYVANNQSIKELRIKQAELKTWRFLLYFGS